MNRRLLLVLLLVGLGVCAPQAWASTLSLANVADIGYPYAGPAYDMTALGNLDWVVVARGEKNATQIIGTQLNSEFGDSTLLQSSPYFAWPSYGAPIFSATDSIGGGALTNADAGFSRGETDGSVHCGANIALPAGSGVFTVWWVYAVGGGDPGFTMTFDDTTNITVTKAGGNLMAQVNYSTSVAQNLAFEMNTYGGFYAMAVSTVPEPGTLALLGMGLVGLVAYAWRKRK